MSGKEQMTEDQEKKDNRNRHNKPRYCRCQTGFNIIVINYFLKIHQQNGDYQWRTQIFFFVCFKWTYII